MVLSALLAATDEQLDQLLDAVGCDCVALTAARLRQWRGVQAIQELRKIPGGVRPSPIGLLPDGTGPSTQEVLGFLTEDDVTALLAVM